MSPPTFHYSWRWGLRSDPASVWPYVSDTDRFRAATGFPLARFTEESRPEGGSQRIGRIRMYGVPIEWEEEPFQWVLNREVREVQHYRIGPLRELKMRLTLQPRPIADGGGTWLTYEVWVTPNNLLGYPGIPIQIGVLFRRRFARTFRHIDDFVQSNTSQPFQTRHTEVSLAGKERLREIAAQVSRAGHDPALVSRTIEFVRNAPDDQLTRIRPFALADQWGVDRYALLEVFLRATRFGLFDLSWDMLCPSCRGAKVQAHSLHDVSAHAHCPSCNINYEVDFDRSVEATFRVNSAIKPVERAEYCLGSPQNTPHMHMQQVLAPGETRQITLDLAQGMYRLAAMQTMRLTERPNVSPATMNEQLNGQTLIAVHKAHRHNEPEHIHAESDELRATITAQELQVAPELGDYEAGPLHLTLVNRTETPQIIVLGQTEWSDQACTAAEVTSLQAFRDLFSSEALRPGESINVENLAILFTDLKGSTALYQSIGDASAFRQVMDHFGILREGVAKHHGGLVKTIGDAIMAVFTDPADAVGAALDIQRGIREYNASHSKQPLVLKLGIHQGTCIAVTLNDRLDYFGTVVNIAARLEGQSHGGDVVVSESIAADPGVTALIDNRKVEVMTFSASLKGFADSFSLNRLSLPTNAAPQAASLPTSALVQAHS